MTNQEIKDMLSPNWNIVLITPYGEIYERTDGCAIITGKWDGKGMDYSVWYLDRPEPTPLINN